MNCCIAEMRQKEVINVKTGCRLGCVCDVEVNTCDGCVAAIVIWGRGKFFGLFGHKDDTRIPWCDIEVIGEDTILVKCSGIPPKNESQKKKGKILDSLFS